MDNIKAKDIRPILFETNIIFRKCLKIWVFFPISLLLFILDMVSKIYVIKHLNGTKIEIIKGLFVLNLTYNPGLNFGLFRDHLIVSIIFSIFFSLLIFMLFLFTSRVLPIISLTLIFTGGFSNVFSRILDSNYSVIDFITFEPFTRNDGTTYAFNLADTYVSVGSILFLIHLLIVIIGSIIFAFSFKEKKELIYKKSFQILKLKLEFEDQLIWPWIMVGYDFNWKEYRLRKKMIKNEYILELEKLKKTKIDVKSKK